MSAINLRVPRRPPVVDHVCLRHINLPLPVGPDPWRRSGKPQPCFADVKLSYSSAIAAATADDVSLSIDYGKLYRRIDRVVQDAGNNHPTTNNPLTGGIAALDLHSHTSPTTAAANVAHHKGDILLGHDVRILAGLLADCALGLLDETIAGVRRMSHVHQIPPYGQAITSRRRSDAAAAAARASAAESLDTSFGECDVRVHLPNAHLRAEGGLTFRSVTAWAYDSPAAAAVATTLDTVAVEGTRQNKVIEQEFVIERIRCYCILGVNSHERLQKQCVVITLAFRGSGETAWASTVVETYQDLTRTVAEVCFPLSSCRRLIC